MNRLQRIRLTYGRDVSRRARTVGVFLKTALIALAAVGMISGASATEGKESMFQYVDLQPYANQPLADDFHPGDYPGDNLAELPPGQITLSGIPFQIATGAVQVAGELLPDHPHSIEEIEVDHQGLSLHFLHAARWGAYGKQGRIRNHWVPDGTPIGFYEVVYEDQHVEAVPIVYGADVRDWWNVWDKSRPTTRSKVIWNGNNDFIRRTHKRDDNTPGLRLYLTTWQNPHPQKTIGSINFVSLEQVATPFCVAITVQTGELDATRRIQELEAEIAELRKQLKSSSAEAPDADAGAVPAAPAF